MAIGQILVLIVGTIAISYALGAQIGFVSATDCSTNKVIDSNSFCYGGNTFVKQIADGTITQTSGIGAGSTFKLQGSSWVLWTKQVDGKTVAQYNPNNGYTTQGVPLDAVPGLTSSGTLSGTANSQSGASEFAQLASELTAPSNTAPSAPPASSNTNLPTGALGITPQTIMNKFGITNYGQAAQLLAECGSDFNCIKNKLGLGGTGTSGNNNAQQTITSDYSTWESCMNSGADSTLCGPNPCVGQTGDALTVCKTGKPVVSTSAGGSGAGSDAGKVVGGILSATLQIAAAVGSALAIHALLSSIEKSIFPGATSKNGAGAAWLELGAYVGGGVAAGVTLAMLTKGVGLAHLSSGGILGISGLTGLGAIGIGAGVAVLAFLIFYRQNSVLLTTFSCVPWQAPTGGSQCQQCGSNGLPCSQYQCASLGQGCKLLNAGQEGKQICANVKNGDTVAPAISTLDILQPGYTYSPSALTIPTTSGDTGVRLLYKGGDVPPFSPVTLGIQTKDEPSKCGIYTSRLPLKDSSGKDTFDSLIPMDSGLFAYNHSFTLSLPSPEAANASGIEISADGIMNLYIRCEDANGNVDSTYFVIQMKISPMQDTTQPVIVNTSVANGAPVAFNASWAQIGVYVSKPVSSCKWDHSDQTYEHMAYTMDCSHANNVLDMNSEGLYTCLANLTGIKDGVKNTFYFRCKDIIGNVNTANPAYAFSLLGTQPLHIDSVTPNSTTIKDSTSPVKVALNVQTSAGADKGAAFCYYYDNSAGTFTTPQQVTNYIEFLNTGTYKSSQDLYLVNGNYNYDIKCVDAAGNADYSEVKFTTQVDTTPPLVVRAYHDTTSLSIVTNENATCVYDVTDCNYQFSDGTPMTTVDGLTHSVAWNSGQTLYILCKDEFGRLPAPGSCSIEVQPSDL